MAHSIPEHFVHTRSTPFWKRESVPNALLTHHNTKKGVYGRLSVMRGAVNYFGFAGENEAEPEMTLTINAGQFGISPPQYWHRIELLTE
ncbi:MAG TPA: cytoplasmic protein, partial [Pantoea sp.]|nr:cytoplasmic protein [Pantoea sp.]